MDKFTLTTIDGKEHEMRALNGRTYRIVSEFDKNLPTPYEPDFIERHAEIIAQFYPDVSVDDVLDMPLEEILPASIAIRQAVFNLTWEKTREISKNSEADKEQSA